MEIKTNNFHAVNESRKWKECVSDETKGLSIQAVMEYFDRQTVNERFQIALKKAKVKQ